MLNCFYKDQSDFVLIFGYHPNRHNKLISKIFEENFLWLKLSSKNIPYSLINEKKKYLIFELLKFLLQKFSKVNKVKDFNKFFCDYLKIPTTEQDENILELIDQFINL